MAEVAVSEEQPSFDLIEDAIASVAAGKFVIVLDDEDRENEGDLIIAADGITTEQMAWFIQHTSGFICISLTPQRIAQLQLPMMVPNNTEKNRTAYTVTVDYRYRTTTGISAHDRALTARMLAYDENQTPPATPDDIPEPDLPQPQDFTRPGHLNPLRYAEGGVRTRMGHTEAAVDLCIAAGRAPAGLLCELVDDSDDRGSIASRDACFRFARKHGIRITTIAMLKRWREENDRT